MLNNWYAGYFPMTAGNFNNLSLNLTISRTHMTTSGHVTAEHFCRSRGKIDKSIDVFYLAVQLDSPHANPDLKALIQHDPDGPEAAALARLTRQILKPADPSHPTIKSAKDVLRALELVQRVLKRPSHARERALDPCGQV